LASDVIVVPESGKVPFLDDSAVVGQVRSAHATSTWAASARIGSMVLGAPGCSTERSTPEWTLDDVRTFGVE
jgi:hypothetical protein